MQAVFGGMAGVGRFYREGPGVVVVHDAGEATVAQSVDIFRSLPSFYHNRFVPSVMENSERRG